MLEFIVDQKKKLVSFVESMSTKDTSSYSPSVNSIDKYDNPYSKTVRQHSDDTQYNNNINKKHRNIYGNKQNGNHQTYHSNQYSDNNINNGYYQTHPTRPQPIQSYHGSQNSIHNGHKTHSSPYYSSSQYNIHDGHNRNHNSHHRNNRHQNGLQQMGQSSPNIFINSSTQNNNNNNNNIHHTQKTSQDHNIYHNGHRHSNPPKQYQGIIGSNGGKNTPSTSPPTPLKQHIKSTTSNLHSYHHQPSPHHAPNSYHHHHQPQQLQQSMTIPASSGQSPSHSFRQQPQQQHYNINHQQQKSLYNGRPHSAKKHGMQYTFTPSQPQQTQQPQTITLSEKYERNIYEQHGVNVTNVTNGGTGTGTGRGRSHTFTPNYSQHEYNQTEEDLIDSYKMANSQQKRNTHSYHQPITPNTISHNQSQQMSLAQIQQIQQQLRMSSSDRRLHQSPQTYHQYQQHHNHNHNHNHHPRNGYPSHYRPSPPISPQVIPQQQSIPPHHTQGLNNFALPMSPSMTTNQSQPVHPTGNHNKQKRNHRSRKQHHHMALTKNNTMPQYNPQLPHTQSEQFVGTKHHHHHNHNRNGYGHNGHNYYGHTNNNHNKHYPSTQSTKTTTTTTTNHPHHANSHYQQQQHQHQHTQSRDKRCQSTPEATPIPSPPARNALSESIAKIDTNASSHNNSFYLIANNEMNTPSSESSSSHPYMTDISSHPYLADDEFSARTNNQSQKSRTSGKKKKTGIEPRREKSKKDRNGKSGGHRSRKKKVDKHHQDKKRRKKKKREAIWGHRKQETNKYFTKKSSHRKLLGNKEFVYKKNETTKKVLNK